jgi:hypothetical protein
MEYNSQRESLLIPEYGRHVQKMIEHAVSVKDREQRNKLAHAIVNVMALLNPYVRDSADYKHKLWDHLFIISGFKLDVDSPYPAPNPAAWKKKPKRVPYPSQKIRLRHYGKNIELMIEEAKKLDDGDSKQALVNAIANFMKMSYLNWNRDAVNDEEILHDLKELSGGELQLGENHKLNISADMIRNTRKSEAPATRGRNSYKRMGNNNRRKR